MREEAAFTIIEVLASTAVLMIVVVLTHSILSSTAEAWKANKARISAFEGARVAFEALTTRLSQATLNTYWDYDDPETPKRYLRMSELHFVMGRAANLIPGISDTSLDAVFFVAPLGFTETPSMEPLVKMLTACGFYVRFSDDPKRPGFLAGRVKSRYRYRLFQFLQPGEQLQIYATATGNAWFQNAVPAWSFPMVDNVLGLILRVKYPTSSGEKVDYAYDSRAGSHSKPTPTYNQLPPVIAATMVVIDEDSARRLAAQYGVDPPPVLPDGNAFTDPAHYEGDLRNWEQKLQGGGGLPKLTYRVLSAEIPIRGAKWSSDQ